MPCYGCAVPVTQTQPMAKLERVRQRRPGQGALGKQGRSLEAPEPSSPRGKPWGDACTSLKGCREQREQIHPAGLSGPSGHTGPIFIQTMKNLLTSPRAAQAPRSLKQQADQVYNQGSHDWSASSHLCLSEQGTQSPLLLFSPKSYPALLQPHGL